MPEWTEQELKALQPVLERMAQDAGPLLEGKRVLVLCSAAGDVAFWLAKQIGNGKVIGSSLVDKVAFLCYTFPRLWIKIYRLREV